MIEGVLIFAFGVGIGALLGFVLSIVTVVLALQNDCNNGHKVHAKHCSLRPEATIRDSTVARLERTH